MSESTGFRWYREWIHPLNARPDLRPTTVRVALALVKHADNDTGICWPAAETLAECASCSVSAVQKAVAQLKRMGSLEVEPGRGRRTSRYRLVGPGAWGPIARTDVRPIEGQGRTNGPCRDASPSDAAPPGCATQPPPGVRPELLRRIPQTSIDLSPNNNPDGSCPAGPPAPVGWSALPDQVVVGEEDEIIDGEIVNTARPEEAPIVLTGVWAEKAERYAAERAEARREQEAQLA